MTAPAPEVLQAFAFSGSIRTFEPFGSGHIHNTYRCTDQNGQRYILQHFNHIVFPDPQAVAENIAAVSTHIRAGLRRTGAPTPERRSLSPVPCSKGSLLHKDNNGQFWRSFDFIESTHTIDVVRTPAQAYALGYAFGQFQEQLSDFRGSLHETIPHFHDTPRRFSALTSATNVTSAERRENAQAHIRFAVQNQAIAMRLPPLIGTEALPIRIAHNDTKVNNLLFDRNTGEGLCVIDLDTVMPGLTLFDFGDMVRTGVVTADENETALDTVHVDLERFQSLTRGYLTAAGSLLTETERSLLAFSGILLTYESGLRFLTDYLLGDVYFNVRSPVQNLDRAANQFRLVKVLLENESAMQKLVEKTWRKVNRQEK